MKNFLFFLLPLLLFTSTLHANEDTNKSKQHLTIQFQWLYQFQFAGFIVAKEKGYYQDLGLDVELLEFDNTDVFKKLESGDAQYVTSNTAIVYKNKEIKPFTLIATYLHRSPLVLLTQKEIKTPNDLYGKKS